MEYENKLGGRTIYEWRNDCEIFHRDFIEGQIEHSYLIMEIKTESAIEIQKLYKRIFTLTDANAKLTDANAKLTDDNAKLNART